MSSISMYIFIIVHPRLQRCMPEIFPLGFGPLARDEI
jgi:hypothetical protein